jgi:hypothetical protein
MISSVSIMSDATALMWATASAWLVLRYVRTRHWPALLLAVLTLSIAVANRWLVALLSVPWTLSVLLMWRAHWRFIGWRHAAALSAGALIIGGSIVGGQLLSGSHTGDLQVVGWDPLNALRRDVVNPDGVFHYDWPMVLFYAQPMAHPAYIFPLLLPLLLVGLWSAWKMKGSRRVILIGWPLLVYGFLAGIAWQNPRFALALLPPLAAWVGMGAEDLSGRVDRSGWRRALIIYCGLALIGAALWSYRVTANLIDRKQIDLERVAYVRAHVPADATVLSFGLTATLDHYTALTVRELFNETPVSLATLLHTGAVYVMIDEANIAAQWAGKAPQINLDWLKQRAGVQPIGSAPPYSLLRVERTP